MQQICTWSVFADRDDVDEGDDYYFQLCPLNIVKDSFRIKQLTEHVYTHFCSNFRGGADIRKQWKQ